MIDEPKTIAVQLGNAVFERIAKDGLLNRELIVDALYRELLVIIAEGHKGALGGADYTSAEKRIVAWLDTAPAPEVGGIEVIRDPKLAQATRARTDAELRECVATAMSTQYGSAVSYENADLGWLNAACTLVDLEVTRNHQLDSWPRYVREAFFKGLGIELMRVMSFDKLSREVRQRWTNVVAAGRAAYGKHAAPNG
jgi:hypothetical protein